MSHAYSAVGGRRGTDPHCGTSRERPRRCESRQRDLPRLSRQRRDFAARAPTERRARCSWRRIILPTACTASVLRCVDCHTTITELPHKNVSKTRAEWDRTRLAINKNCSNCHAKAAQGYTETYHGQVVAMGFADGATCADCHGSHAILRASDPASSVAPANLLKTCQKCHPGRDAGLRDVPTARHDRRLRALSLYVDRLEVREHRGRRRALVLLDPFGALVLPRISRPPAAQAAAACADGCAAAR